MHLSNPVFFADAFNYLLYDGEQVIKPDELKELDTTELIMPFGNNARIPVQKYRDLLKMWNAILREIISNSLAHRDYSNGYVAKMVIERDRILVENGNRAHGIGVLDLKTFKPFAKNPPISKIFREINENNT